MSKELTLEDYQDKMNKLQRQQMQIVVDADKLAKEIQETSEKFYELSPEYVKVICFQCGGAGIIKGEEEKKVKCPVCDMNGFLWMKKYSKVMK